MWLSAKIIQNKSSKNKNMKKLRAILYDTLLSYKKRENNIREVHDQIDPSLKI